MALGSVSSASAGIRSVATSATRTPTARVAGKRGLGTHHEKTKPGGPLIGIAMRTIGLEHQHIRCRGLVPDAIGREGYLTRLDVQHFAGAGGMGSAVIPVARHQIPIPDLHERGRIEAHKQLAPPSLTALP